MCHHGNIPILRLYLYFCNTFNIVWLICSIKKAFGSEKCFFFFFAFHACGVWILFYICLFICSCAHAWEYVRSCVYECVCGCMCRQRYRKDQDLPRGHVVATTRSSPSLTQTPDAEGAGQHQSCHARSCCSYLPDYDPPPSIQEFLKEMVVSVQFSFRKRREDTKCLKNIQRKAGTYEQTEWKRREVKEH